MKKSALLVLVLVMSSFSAFAQADAAAVGQAHFSANAGRYGLGNADEMRVRKVSADAKMTHVRYDQFYRGIPVFEGEAIAHVRNGRVVEVTNAIRGNLNVNTSPSVGSDRATEIALRDIAPTGSASASATLKVLPAGDHSARARLVWHVATFTEGGAEGPHEWQYFVDAHTGEVALKFDALHTTDTLGTASTMFAGDQPISVDLTDKYYLRDATRSGNYTMDMNNGTSGGAVASSLLATFGDGQKTDCSGNPNRSTAAGEAHFGMALSWDYFKNTFGRNGIDGTGKRAYSRVHYDNCYQNAFWSDSCFCMTYGDGGATFYPLVSIDVAGHEMAHGVMSTEANLTYRGESGGLNESSSDIFGTTVEYSAASVIDPGDYWIGERIYRSNYDSNGAYTQTRALRYMDDPAKDGNSPACWSRTVKGLDVHYSSGPNNHMFYLLAQGGTSKCNSKAVTGIGQAKAAAIWYEAITNWMTASTNYAGARTACLNAAAKLYGSGSAEYNAVAAAYSAINVN